MHTNVPGWWEVPGAGEVVSCQGFRCRNGVGYVIRIVVRVTRWCVAFAYEAFAPHYWPFSVY